MRLEWDCLARSPAVCKTCISGMHASVAVPMVWVAWWGYGKDARYEYLSVTGGSVMSPSAGYVGGMVGDGRNTNIRYANVSGTDVFGNSGVGGLVGLGYEADIRYTYVSDGNVTGLSHRIGGLVGLGWYADIRSAYASGTDVAGRNDVGGLVGGGFEADIRYAYASGGSVTGNRRVGGLVGSGHQPMGPRLIRGPWRSNSLFLCRHRACFRFQ